jgi:glucose-1-phosphate thymidylyltransferase
MIYYPLSTLMLAGIRDVLVISTPQDTPRFQQLLGDGSQWGMNLQYAVQPSPDGLAQAFIIGEDFIGNAPARLVLGDNIFYGHDFQPLLARRAEHGRHRVRLPRDRPRALRRGRVRRPGQGQSIEEKPKQPKSNYAVTGLYFYDSRWWTSPRPSSPAPAASWRSPTSTRPTWSKGQLNVQIMGRGYAWLDTGTHDSLLEAGQFIATLEKPPGPEGRLPGRNRLAQRLDRRRPAGARWPPAGQERLRPVPAGPAKGRPPCLEPHPTAIPDVIVLEPKVFGDARGFFFESFNQRDFEQATGLDVQFVQDNHSRSRQRRAARPALPDPAHGAGQAGARGARRGVRRGGGPPPLVPPPSAVGGRGA